MHEKTDLRDLYKCTTEQRESIFRTVVKRLPKLSRGPIHTIPIGFDRNIIPVLTRRKEKKKNRFFFEREFERSGTVTQHF